MQFRGCFILKTLPLTILFCNFAPISNIINSNIKMVARFIFLSFIMLVGTLAPAKAQNSFPYPALPDTLRSVEQRAAYLSEHY